MSDKTAFQEGLAYDLRRERAMQLASLIMSEINDLIPKDPINHDLHRRFDERLFDLFHRNGYSVTTDDERSRYGFEPRDGLGWTASERVQAERDRVNAMLNLTGITLTSEAISGCMSVKERV